MPVRPRRQRRRGLSHGAREERRDRRRWCRNAASASSRCWSAPSASRNPRSLAELLQEAQDPAQRAQCPLPRAGGLHHRPGRPARRRHDRDQHGRPRHRHPARRQSRHARAQGAGRHRRTRPSAPRGRRRSAARSTRRARSCSRPAASSSSPASGMKAAASTTSCAAARAARAIPAPRSSSSRSKTI